ncbi:hypothetical protein D3C72_1011650 [compost metagenome]
MHTPAIGIIQRFDFKIVDCEILCSVQGNDPVVCSTGRVELNRFTVTINAHFVDCAGTINITECNSFVIRAGTRYHIGHNRTADPKCVEGCSESIKTGKVCTTRSRATVDGIGTGQFSG